MGFRNQHHRSGRGMRQFSDRGPPASLPQPDVSQKLVEKFILNSILINEDEFNQSRIQNVEHVASFNWKEARTPTILVPGKPPKWQPLAILQTLHEDEGLYYRDPNSARYPSYPTEPAIRAIQKINPNFNVSEIDIFGCGSTIGSLLSFVQGEERTFRFGVELVGSSLFLVRKTNKPGEAIDGVYGYGHSFLEAYTTWEKDVRGSASHQRIIKYDFAGLKCFVRSESDGYLPDRMSHKHHEDKSSKTDLDHDTKISELTATNHLSSLALSLTPTDSSSISKHLTIENSGHAIPQPAIFDLKTRTIKRKLLNHGSISPDIDQFLPRLWVNQTPNLILAYHTRGNFAERDIHVEDVRQKVSTWETENCALLTKLGALLHKLISAAKKQRGKREGSEAEKGNEAIEVRRTGNGPLEIWTEATGWSALPDDLKVLWGERVGDRVEYDESTVSNKMTIGASKKSTETALNRNNVNRDDEEDTSYLRF